MDFFLWQFEPVFLTVRFEVEGSAGLLIEWLDRSVTQYIFVFAWTYSEREAIIFFTLGVNGDVEILSNRFVTFSLIHYTCGVRYTHVHASKYLLTFVCAFSFLCCNYLGSTWCGWEELYVYIKSSQVYRKIVWANWCATVACTRGF